MARNTKQSSIDGHRTTSSLTLYRGNCRQMQCMLSACHPNSDPGTKEQLKHNYRVQAMQRELPNSWPVVKLHNNPHINGKSWYPEDRSQKHIIRYSQPQRHYMVSNLTQLSIIRFCSQIAL